MPLPLWGLMALGAGLGLLKNEAVDKPKEKRQREMQSITTRYSPWTHLRGQAPQESDALGNMMQGGMTGAAMGQNLQANQQQLEFGEKHPTLAYSRAAGGYGYPWWSALAADARINQDNQQQQLAPNPKYPFAGAGNL